VQTHFTLFSLLWQKFQYRLAQPLLKIGSMASIMHYPAFVVSSHYINTGFYAALVFITVWTIGMYRQLPSQAYFDKYFHLSATNKHYMKSTKAALSGLVILMYICSTVHAAVNWSWFSKAVDANELPGSKGLFDSLRHIPPWQEAVGNTFFALNILFADSLLVSECLGCSLKHCEFFLCCL